MKRPARSRSSCYSCTYGASSRTLRITATPRRRNRGWLHRLPPGRAGSHCDLSTSTTEFAPCRSPTDSSASTPVPSTSNPTDRPLPRDERRTRRPRRSHRRKPPPVMPWADKERRCKARLCDPTQVTGRRLRTKLIAGRRRSTCVSAPPGARLAADFLTTWPGAPTVVAQHTVCVSSDLSGLGVRHPLAVLGPEA